MKFYVVGAAVGAAVVAFSTLSLDAAPLGPAAPGTALIGYNPANGHVLISANRIRSWQIRSSLIVPGVVDLPDGLNAVDLVYTNPAPGVEASIGQSGAGPLTYADVDLGPVAAPGLNSSSFTLGYVADYGFPELDHDPYFLPIPPDAGPAPPGTAFARYNSATGRINVSANGVLSWYIEALGLMTGAPAQLPTMLTHLTTDNDDRVGQTTFASSFLLTFVDADLGPIFPMGMNPADVRLLWSSLSSYSQTTAVVIPEPTTLSLTCLALAAPPIAGRHAKKQA